jgi:predicted methyltransferase
MGNDACRGRLLLCSMPMNAAIGPLLTSTVNAALLAARNGADTATGCSLDLGLSTTKVVAQSAQWISGSHRYPYLDTCKPRTIYHWTGARFEPVSRYGSSLIKLIPTDWGAPTFEIDGIKMLATARISPLADAERKVELIQPRGKLILDTCGGLGYFAASCIRGQSAHVHSFEKNPDVIWLRSLNPWSPDNLQSIAGAAAVTLMQGDITQRISGYPKGAFDAILHDPPRFGIAGELYSQDFYDQLARVLKARGRMFHYTGSPNRVSSGRDLRGEVITRLRRAGFLCEPCLDGVLAVKTRGTRT